MSLPQETHAPIDRPLAGSVLQQLQIRSRQLRMIPAVAMQALEISKDANCGINELAAVVERDSMLASEILRMANSIMFAGGRPLMNLHQAVVRIGLRQCKSLIIASSFNSMMKQMTLDEEWIRKILYRHSFTTALLALNLNRSLGVGFQGEEFAGGLIHDIGRVVLATCFPDRFAEIDPLDFLESGDTLEHEQSVIDSDHCAVGVWFARKSTLPEALIDVIRFHHCPDQARRNRRFVALIVAADHAANHLQRCNDAAGYDPRGNPGITLLEQSGMQKVRPNFEKTALSIMESSYRDAVELASL